MSRSATRSTGFRAVVSTCLAVTVLDGVDLLMFGAVLPVLLQDQVWGMTTVEAGLIGSVSLFGMMIGAMLAGCLTDIVGRRPIVLGCVASFSVFTGLCALAPSLEVFAILRFLAGLGFGGALPTVIALTMEYVRIERRQFYNGVVQTGFPIGGALVSVIAIVVIPVFGWQSLFAAAGLVGIVLFVVAYRNLPESMAFLVARGRADEAAELARRYEVGVAAESGLAVRQGATAGDERRSAFRLLSAPGFRVAAVLFPLISFFGLLVSYGMNTWIPQILRTTGYDLGSALSFMLAFNLGSAVGMVVLTGLADRFGSRRVISTGFLAGAAAVAALTLGPAQGVVFGLVLLIGFCASSQSAVYGFAGVYYPAAARGTVLGLCTGLGRLGGVAGPIMVGIVIAAPAGATGVFWAFTAVGLVAAVLVALVPRTGLTDRPRPVVDDGPADRQVPA
ncbi:MFS transporter [Pseudonocardia sp. EC080610-09]|uniref:MFS transporter n=1 Tax=unclassified Pseudonocardia TaxID=2619320 RepID=UPI0007066652|nr:MULTISPECIES: MFS transporter [unclassified Pseudonocardia]ALL78203.1 MFS transporter [Pseudonocardia sp. EC080610-09]ALL81115.1 MFS transporter [Pseudonocardia sp. EC080619-01]